MKKKIWLYILLVHVAVLGIVVLLDLPYGGIGAASCQWDCADAYRRIIQQGYDRTPTLAAYWLGQANWAFFPAFPMVMKGVMYLTGLSMPNAGIVINAILLPILVYLCYVYQSKKYGPIDFRIYALFFLTFPPTLWLRIQYTECMYGLLLVGTSWFLLKNRIYIASLCAFLLCLSRPTGILCVMVLAPFYFFNECRQTNRIGLIEGRFERWVPPVTNTMMLLTAGGAGLSLFMIYLYYLTGDSLAFSHIQIGWDRKFHIPGYWMLYQIQKKSHINWVISAVLDMLVIYMGFRKKLYVEATTLLVTFMFAFSSSLMSIHRIIMANPFFFMIVYACVIDMSKTARNVFIWLFFIILMGITVFWSYGTKILY
ncbi:MULTISPECIES: hypothetical protein [Komagataeibacter]|uniref:hypothetical protein n=1 Tax=Komagataeibacter TaxID=1434011 RepID=UPI0006628C12|nr:MULTISPECIES: hypothetical protein [Komagataeibacter]MBV1822608.1 hypothetical protein [Komagataeibacter oboediens]